MASLVSLTTKQFSTSCHISPLVRTTDLKSDIVVLVKNEEVVPLHDLVSELSVRNPCFNPFFHRLLTHHVVDSEVFSDITEEVNEADAAKPVVVVDHDSFIFTIFKVKKARKLSLDRLDPAIYCVFCLETTFSIFEGRISDETCSTANERIRFVTC